MRGAALGPGLHRGLTMEDYLGLPHMSASRLHLLDRSPLQYLHSLDAPPTVTPALERGSALHMAILEPEEFDGHYVVLGQCAGRKRDGDRCKYQGSVYRDGESYCGTHDPAKGEPIQPGITIIGAEDRAKVVGMRDAVLAHRRASSLFLGGGEFEATIVFDDPATGVRVKIRPDRLVDRAGMLVELKSTRDATHHRFSSDAERRGYFRKVALYRRGLRAIEWPYRMAAVLAIESDAPHDLIPYLLDESDLDGADAEITRLLRLYQDCEREGAWPGYADEFQTLSRPRWASGGDTFDIQSAA